MFCGIRLESSVRWFDRSFEFWSETVSTITTRPIWLLFLRLFRSWHFPKRLQFFLFHFNMYFLVFRRAFKSANKLDTLRFNMSSDWKCILFEWGYLCFFQRCRWTSMQVSSHSSSCSSSRCNSLVKEIIVRSNCNGIYGCYTDDNNFCNSMCFSVYINIFWLWFTFISIQSQHNQYNKYIIVNVFITSQVCENSCGLNKFILL